MTWLGSPGTGMPQPCGRAVDREMEKSSKPPWMKPKTSLRRSAGSIRASPGCGEAGKYQLRGGEAEEGAAGSVLGGDDLRPAGEVKLRFVAVTLRDPLAGTSLHVRRHVHRYGL